MNENVISSTDFFSVLAEQLPPKTQCIANIDGEDKLVLVLQQNAGDTVVGFMTPKGYLTYSIHGSDVVSVSRSHLVQKLERTRRELEQLTAERDAIIERISEFGSQRGPNDGSTNMTITKAYMGYLQELA